MIKRVFLILVIVFFESAFAMPSLDKLAGICTNKYNIRNDILIYINDAVPNFSRAWRSFIKIAANKQFLYYHAKTYDEAHEVVRENSIEMRCLSKEYKDNEDYRIFHHIEEMMSDTPERRQHIFEVSNGFFAGRGFKHPKITKEEIEAICGGTHA